jgi:hypothetical protein
MSDAADAISALQGRNPYARDLARLASIAVQVEPELLRRLRLRLLQDADASAEADLWFSELVDSQSPNAMVLRADVRAQLQQELASSAMDRDAAAAIIAEMHAGASEVMRIQEQVDALSLRDDPAARAQIEQILQPIVRTLYDKDHAGLARWAARAFAQFRPAAQETPAAWSMMRAAAVRLTSSGGNAERPTVVVSSTFVDLQEHRSATISILRRLGYEPVSSEFDSLTGDDLLGAAFKAIDRASAFLGIVGPRSGFVLEDPRNPERLTISHLEYRHAMDREIPVLMYLSEVVRLPAEPGATHAFRVEVGTRGVYSTFTTVEELSALVTRDFTKLRDAMNPSGWQNVEAAIRALPSTPIYLSLYRHSLVAGTTPVDGAARIDIPLTEPLLLDVAAQRISLAGGQSVEVPVDPRNLTVATILGEQYEIRTPAKFDDWAAIAVVDGHDRAAPLRNWLMEMTGGAIPEDQCLERKAGSDPYAGLYSFNIVRQVISRLNDDRANTLYVYVTGPDTPFFEIDEAIKAIREAATHFRSVILFVDLARNLFSQRESNVYVIDAEGLLGNDFISILIDGLSGGAAVDGRVTPTSLTAFVRQNRGPDPRSGEPNEPVLAAADEFSSFVQIRSASQSGRLSVRLLDPSFTTIKVLEREVSYLKLLHGRYTLDDPKLALVERFETSHDEPMVVVEAGRRQRDHWIIIAGTAAKDLPYDQQLIAAALGERLAGSGFRLLVGNWTGIDNTVLVSFGSMLATLNVDSRDQVRQFAPLQPNLKPASARVVAVNIASDDEEYDAPLREASALIAIGGRGGTYEYGRRATARQIPVLPIASTGGDAAKLYSELPASPEWLSHPIEDHDGANTMAIRIMAWLIDSLPPVLNLK